jgi:hypothetical protein
LNLKGPSLAKSLVANQNDAKFAVFSELLSGNTKTGLNNISNNINVTTTFSCVGNCDKLLGSCSCDYLCAYANDCCADVNSACGYNKTVGANTIVANTSTILKAATPLNSNTSAVKNAPTINPFTRSFDLPLSSPPTLVRLYGNEFLLVNGKFGKCMDATNSNGLLLASCNKTISAQIFRILKISSEVVRILHVESDKCIVDSILLGDCDNNPPINTVLSKKTMFTFKLLLDSINCIAADENDVRNPVSKQKCLNKRNTHQLWQFVPVF